MHITIERDGCISCGLCEGTCPSVFRIAEDGLAEVHHQPETAEEQAGAQEALIQRGIFQAQVRHYRQG